jgi:ribosomal protein L11 methyltransferase
LYSLLIHCTPGEEDLLIASLWDAGTSGIAEEPGGVRAFFEDSIPIAALRAEFGAAIASVRQEKDVDWGQVSHDAFPPVEVGERFYLVPPWDTGETPAGRVRLVINPGMACGTGYHPCTQLCLEAMERVLHPGAAVLDVGSGSGILSEAAVLLGAGLVVGCDIDADSVRVARERVRTPAFVGSADAVHARSADLIVANISASAAEDLWDDFGRVGRPGSVWIVSGFRTGELLLDPPAERLDKDGWSCWIVHDSLGK